MVHSALLAVQWYNCRALPVWSTRGDIPKCRKFNYKHTCAELHHGICTARDHGRLGAVQALRRRLMDMVLDSMTVQWLRLVVESGDEDSKLACYLFVAYARKSDKQVVFAKCSANTDAASEGGDDPILIRLQARGGAGPDAAVYEFATPGSLACALLEEKPGRVKKVNAERLEVQNTDTHEAVKLVNSHFWFQAYPPPALVEAKDEKVAASQFAAAMDALPTGGSRGGGGEAEDPETADDAEGEEENEASARSEGVV